MGTKQTILVVDEDQAHRTMLRTLLTGWGYAVNEADDGATAVAMVHEQAFDLILMDIRMIRVSGLEALAEIKTYNPAIPVVIMTAYSSVETAVDALKKGAYDYLTKPLDFDELQLTMERAMDHSQLREENRLLRESLGTHFDRRNIIGQSPAMVKLLETVAQVAPTEATILVTGESGTGKELVAGAIHFNSPRKERPFVKMNCAAVTETLLESELFGHEKGAFTGAHRQKEGRFLQADKGSLFLDEVIEMSLSMQVKLLRVLQERVFERVGGNKEIQTDVRIIAATHQNLEDMIKEGKFREDLFYRLNVFPIDMPPLRDRIDDVPLLVNELIARMENEKRGSVRFTPASMMALCQYRWPGNVRELSNLLERMVIMYPYGIVDVADLPAKFRPAGSAKANTEMPNINFEQHLMPSADFQTSRLPREGIDLKEHISSMECSLIKQALDEAGGVVAHAAKRLKMRRTTLVEKLRKYGLQRNETATEI